MKNLISLALIFTGHLTFAAESVPEWSPVWFTCEKHSECIMARGACEPEPVNEVYKLEFEAYSRELSTRVDCNYNRPDVVLFPVCRESTCVSDPQEPSDKN